MPVPRSRSVAIKSIASPSSFPSIVVTASRLVKAKICLVPVVKLSRSIGSRASSA